MKPIVAALATALAVRLLVPVLALPIARPGPQFREPDTVGYVRVATQWWETGRYGAPQQAEIVRTPGYPVLLLPGVASERIEAVTIGLQILLGCLTVWFVYRTALLAFENETVALAGAWFMACEPVSAVYASKLLSETLFTTLLAAALWLLARYSVSRGWRDILAAAVAIAAAAYVRPIAYFLPAWVGLSVVIIFWRRVEWRRHLLVQAVVFVALAFALLVPWQIRNFFAAGYAGFSAISDINLYYYEALPIVAEREAGGPVERDAVRIEAGEGDPAAYLRQHPEQIEWSAAQRYRFLRQEAMRIILAHPSAWARVHVGGMLNTLTDSGRNAWLGFFRLADTGKPTEAPPARTFWQRLTDAAAQRPRVLAIHGLLAVTLAIYLGLAFTGVVSAGGPGARPAVLLALALFTYLLLVSGGDAGYHRFRIPMTPVICLFAAQGGSTAVALARRYGLVRRRATSEQ
ncbi:MAG TPA: glycosyltransferase family 39 protein [Pirellulales bacterium]|nr:glycosyltransferase family 39 protein [Pirellulales bacterium]